MVAEYNVSFIGTCDSALSFSLNIPNFPPPTSLNFMVFFFLCSLLFSGIFYVFVFFFSLITFAFLQV